jgi:hypothetical protein
MSSKPDLNPAPVHRLVGRVAYSILVTAAIVGGLYFVSIIATIYAPFPLNCIISAFYGLFARGYALPYLDPPNAPDQGARQETNTKEKP